MRFISYFLFILLFASFLYANEESEKEFHIDPDIIFQDITNKHVKLLKTYFSKPVPIAIDINKCSEDTIVLYREESKESGDKYYKEIYKLQNEELIKTNTEEIHSSIYSDMRLAIENRLIDLVEKYKDKTQITLNMLEINNNINIEHILFYPEQMHTILRVLIGKEEELVVISYGVVDKLFYKKYDDKIIIIAVSTSMGASSFSQSIDLYKLDTK